MKRANIDINVDDIPVSIKIRGAERDEAPSLDFSDIESKYRQVDSSQADSGEPDRRLFTDETGGGRNPGGIAQRQYDRYRLFTATATDD